MSYSNTTSSGSSKITAANAVVVGGKTARACDSCVKKRARWYCAADDAFLCQSCDSSVHSANSLARRHHRLRLKTSSSSSSSTPSTPTWHQGFTRKARTPRNAANSAKHAPPKTNARDLHFPSSPIVPEIAATAASNDDEQLLYRVPIFDPLVAELYNNNNNTNHRSSDQQYCSSPPKAATVSPSSTAENSGSLQGGGFLPSEMDLAEFAADVESLLGQGLENECDFGIEGLGFVDCEDNRELSSGGIVKIELDDDDNEAMNVDMKICWAETSMENFEVNFEDYEESPTSCGEEDVDIDKKVAILSKIEAQEDVKKCHKLSNNNNKKKRKILLRLDYESVITAWASQGSPWTNGARPDFDTDVAWPDCMGSYSDQFHNNHRYMNVSGIGGTSTILADGGREARVSRYREKRRTRLFSKKIRYEVRKLNAEKRPRMKGRFVKRISFSGPSFPMLN